MQPLCPSRVRSTGLLVVALGLFLPTCGDGDGKSSGLGPARLGGAGGASGGQGGGGNPSTGGSGSGQGGGGGGGSLDAGGTGADSGGGTGPATIKFCNTLIIGDGMQSADTTIELTVGTVKLTSVTNTCSPPAPMPCTTVPAGANRVTMTVLDPPPQPGQPAVIFDKMITFNAGTAHLVLSTIDQAAMTPSLISMPFPAGTSCAAFVPPPTTMKFCNRFFRGTTPVTLELDAAGVKFTAMSGTCSPALNQMCLGVPSGGQTLTLREGATVLATANLALVPALEAIIHASPMNGMPVLGGLELDQATMCSTVDYMTVDQFLTMNPPPMAFQSMQKVNAPSLKSKGPGAWKLMPSGARFELPSPR